jgi:hypothetical protein
MIQTTSLNVITISTVFIIQEIFYNKKYILAAMLKVFTRIINIIATKKKRNLKYFLYNNKVLDLF